MPLFKVIFSVWVLLTRSGGVLFRPMKQLSAPERTNAHPHARRQIQFSAVIFPSVEKSRLWQEIPINAGISGFGPNPDPAELFTPAFCCQSSQCECVRHINRVRGQRRCRLNTAVCRILTSSCSQKHAWPWQMLIRGWPECQEMLGFRLSPGIKVRVGNCLLTPGLALWCLSEVYQ